MLKRYRPVLRAFAAWADEQEADLRAVCPHEMEHFLCWRKDRAAVRLEVVSKLLSDSSTAVMERHYAELLKATIRTEMPSGVNA
jgi:hypothetical protein